MDLSSFSKEIKGKPELSKENDNLTINFKNLSNEITNKNDLNKNYFLPWFVKYNLNDFSDLTMSKEIKQIIDYIEKKDYKKAVLLYGHPGSGKTSTLTLFAKKYDFELFELNASDTRNKKSIELELGNAINQKSLFSKTKMIVLDEIDGISGMYDRGGVSSIVNFIKKAKQPIFLTANEIDIDKLKPIKKVCHILNFENHLTQVLVDIGIKIFKGENIKYKEQDLENFIKKREVRDIRGFINDLQANCFNNKFVLDENYEIRDYKKILSRFLDSIFYNFPEDSLNNCYKENINLDDLMSMLEENLPEVYTQSKELYKAFENLSKADLFKGRIHKRNHWRFLVYVNFYLTYGVSNSKIQPKKLIKEYKRNQRFLKIWIYTNSKTMLNPRSKIQKKNNEKIKFIEKLAKKYNLSAKRCRSQILPYFVLKYKNNINFQIEMDKELQICEKTKKQLLKY
jgi:replication factor C large subunit